MKLSCQSESIFTMVLARAWLYLNPRTLAPELCTLALRRRLSVAKGVSCPLGANLRLLCGVARAVRKQSAPFGGLQATAWMFYPTQRPQSSSFLGLPYSYRILNMNPKKELLWGLWVA